MSITHKFVSSKSEQPDTTLVGPNEWNANHVIGSGAIQSGAIASGATSWNLFGPSKPFVTVTQSGPTDGGDYGPGTVGTTTMGIQEAVNALPTSGGRILIRYSTSPYLISGQISTGVDTEFDLERGTTLKWAGGSPAGNTAMFTNSGVVNIRWHGGTIDQNSQSNVYAIGFGSTAAGSANTKVASMKILDLTVVGVKDDAMLINNVGNTDVFLQAKVTKIATASTADMINLDGTRCDCEVVVDLANVVGMSAITSAYLKDSVWRVRSLNSNNVAAKNDVVLQAFTNSGVFSPFFNNVDIYCAGGWVNLTNGNLTSGVIGGQNVRIHGQNGLGWFLGGGVEIWKEVSIDGQFIPPNTNVGQMNGPYDGVTLDVDVDAVNLPNTLGGNGLIYCTGTTSGTAIDDYLTVKFIRVKNLLSGAVANVFWAQGTPTYRTQIGHFKILGGDVQEGVTSGLLLTNFTYANSTVLSGLVIRNVQGYNPQGFATTTPVVPASTVAQQNTNPYPVEIYITGGTVTVISVTPYASTTATTLFTATPATVRLEPGDSITLTYSVAPTWKWYGL